MASVSSFRSTALPQPIFAKHTLLWMGLQLEQMSRDAKHSKRSGRFYSRNPERLALETSQEQGNTHCVESRDIMRSTISLDETYYMAGRLSLKSSVCGIIELHPSARRSTIAGLFIMMNNNVYAVVDSLLDNCRVLLSTAAEKFYRCTTNPSHFWDGATIAPVASNCCNWVVQGHCWPLKVKDS